MSRMQPAWAGRRARPVAERIEGQGFKRRTLDRDRIMVVTTYASGKSFVQLTSDPEAAQRLVEAGNPARGSSMRWFWVEKVNGVPFVPPQQQQGASHG